MSKKLALVDTDVALGSDRLVAVTFFVVQKAGAARHQVCCVHRLSTTRGVWSPESASPVMPGYADLQPGYSDSSSKFGKD